MMSPSDTSLMEEGTDMDGVDREGVEWERGAADSYYDLNCVSLRFMVAVSMTQI